ncbi:methyltransferase domain-containing protein [Niabella ginsengisoli]|uniref:methyltransferase domain-containing protein n=1 Tax=Niabella ginsengisoli TaxID=522298 RepID=UPI00374D4694
MDGVNFNTSTVWEGNIEAGENYQYLQGYPKGTQLIAEAADLEGIANNSYDFLLSCHSLEHVANPIKALKRWHEILKPGGSVYIIVPNKEVTFDKNRPYTTFEHLVADYKNNIDERDNTHVDEVLKLHSIADDEGVKDYEELEERMKNIFVNRCIHHHVFSLEVMKQALEYCNFKVMLQKTIHSLNLFSVGVKP